MATSSALALIIATTFSGIFVFMYTIKLTNDVAAEIVTGALASKPVTTKYRWLMLHQVWVPYSCAAVICAVAVAVINVKIAEYATEAGIKPAAHLFALFGAVAAFGGFFASISAFIEFRSILRQAEAD